MKAIICTKYGPPEVLQMAEVEKPVPKDNEILIRNYATSVNSGDARIRRFDVPPIFWLPFRLFMGILKPRQSILGVDMAGVVEAVGKDVKLFKKGDRIFGSSYPKMGCYAEYKSIPEDSVITEIPEKMKFEEVTPLFFGGHTALHFLRKGNIQKGQKVIVYGASGSIGTYAVQLAKYFGAEVTGVCSTANLELVRSLGADSVIDYTKEDFTRNGEIYDIIFDTVGESPFSCSLKSLSKNGYYLRAVHMKLTSILRGMWVSVLSKKKVIGGVAHEFKEDLDFLTKLYSEGHIKPVIDRTYPIEEIVEAHRHVDNGHKKGNVVIKIEHND